MINLTAYDTTACNGYLMGSVVESIKRNIVGETSVQRTDKLNNVFQIVERPAETYKVIPFAHPLVFDKKELAKLSLLFDAGGNQTHNDRFVVITDVRGFGKWNNVAYDYTVVNTTEYNLNLVRAGLQELWVNEGPGLLQSAILPISVYASWISENVARRYNLDPREQLRLFIYAGFYYTTLFTNDEVPSESEKLRINGMLQRALGTSAADTLEVLDAIADMDPIRTINDFCNSAAHVCGTVRLEDLNTRILFAMLGGTWYGLNHNEMVHTALEHPPTWMAILVSAFNERSYKNSGITKMTERNRNQEAGKTYVHATLNLIQFKL